MEESELREMIRHALSNAKSKSYRHLVDSCLSQHMGLAQDLAYDMEVARGVAVGVTDGSKKSGRRRAGFVLQERVRRIVQEVNRI